MGLGLIPRLNYKLTFSDFANSFKYSGVNKRIKQNLSEYFGNSFIFLIDSARSALLVGLESYGLPRGTRVGVVAYNCHTVFNAIRLAGFVPVFIDINEDFSINMDDLTSKSQEMKIIVVTHLFGFVSDVRSIKKSFPEISIIEDCAHAFLSRNQDNNIVGNDGDLSVFSINTAKFPSVGGGGFLVVNNHQMYNNINRRVKFLRRISIIREIFQVFQKFSMSILHHPLIYQFFTFPLKAKLRIKPLHTAQNHIPKSISKFDKSLFSHILGKIPDFYRQQQLNAQKIYQILGIPDNFHERSNCFLIPILYEGDREVLITKFRKNGIELGHHFSNSLKWAKDFGYYTGSCKTAEMISRKIITIPCYYSLSTRELDKIKHYINQIEL